MKREVKIGIFGVTMIIAAWAGIRFLKGFDIFSRNSVYYAAYDQINGVQAASPIMMKGVKIGTVTAFRSIRSAATTSCCSSPSNVSITFRPTPRPRFTATG